MKLNYIFDQRIERRKTNSLKWDATSRLYGKENLLPLWVADMDFHAPEPVIEVLKQKVEHGIFGYSIKPQLVDEAVVDWLARRFTWRVSEKDIVYTSGVVPAIDQIIQEFTEEGDKIIIQSPVYHPFFTLVTNNKRELVENPLVYKDRYYTMDFDNLEANIDEKTKLLLLCSPHNPVGRVWKREELEQLAEICIKHDLIIIADEIHADLVFAPHKHIPFASLSEELAKRTITCMAPSKTFNLAGLQASYVIIENEQWRRRLQLRLEQRFVTMQNTFALPALEAAYRHGEEWLEQLIIYLKGNLDCAKQFFERECPQIKLIEPEGTYLLWLDCSRMGLTDEERKRWLVEDAKLALNHGPMFGKQGSGFERMNIACSRETLKQALSNLNTNNNIKK
ncbi:MAG TPA: putative C-S lyase [Bacilli bacterium]|nr:putative C-S lyase [Bacilli bacterium]